MFEDFVAWASNNNSISLYICRYNNVNTIFGKTDQLAKRKYIIYRFTSSEDAAVQICDSTWEKSPFRAYVTGSRKRDHFADLLESRYRRLNSNNYNKTFFDDLSFLLANCSRIFPLPLYQILSFVLFSK